MDLAATSLGEASETLAVADGPSAVLEAVTGAFGELLESAGRCKEELRHRPRPPGPGVVRDRHAGAPTADAGLGRVPGPRLAGRSLRSSAVVDNDVSLMAFGEQRTWLDDCAHLLFVKVGAGIGCGISANGRILRGADGAAGDVGHMRVTGHDDVRCNCGNQGCLEAVAGSAAIAARLAEAGRDGGRERGRRAARPWPPAPTGSSARRGAAWRGARAASASSTLERSSSAAPSCRHRSPCWPVCAKRRSGARRPWPRATCGWCRAGSGARGSRRRRPPAVRARLRTGRDRPRSSATRGGGAARADYGQP